MTGRQLLDSPVLTDSISDRYPGIEVGSILTYSDVRFEPPEIPGYQPENESDDRAEKLKMMSKVIIIYLLSIYHRG